MNIANCVIQTYQGGLMICIECEIGYGPNVTS